jgi:hypothetical protein
VLITKLFNLFGFIFRYQCLQIAAKITPSIQQAFPFFAICAVVFPTPSIGKFPAKSCTATKGTAKVFPISIAWLGQKENPAMTTSLQIFSQVRTTGKGLSKGAVIRQTVGASFRTMMPDRKKFIK